ncbi:PQQ-dependent sugar dehydrogenase [Tropicimonas sp. S265A]|uniref:PQQ-dependent sugar dehydrogenase n=1 Tax=Tropicimonas sp. S265A TaxID=3415134 RepID=UPI003C7E8DD9
MKDRISAFALCTAMAALAGPAFAANTTSLTHTLVLSDLENPWDMAFLPDGTMFYTEKCKGLSVRLPDGSVNKLLGMQGTEDDYASTAEDLFCEGQAGMQGVAVDPDFAENRQIYVYSTSNMTAPGTNRLMRMTVGEDLASVGDRTDIVEDVRYKPEATDHPFGGPGAHNGGRVRFGPDGFIYLTTGDTHFGEGPQSPTIIAGKVLRIDRDGNAAEGNSPPDGFDPRIYTYGHRNVQGIAFHPSTGTPITAEHGPWHSDEITVLVNGGNAGWDPRPNVGGRGACPDDYCGYSPNQMEGMDRYERAAFMPMTDLATYPDAMPPIWDNNGWSQGTSSAAFLTGSEWSAWENHMVVGIMGIGFGGTPIGQRIDVIELNDAGTEVVDVTEMTLPMEAGRFRSLVLGPDGALYAAVDQGMIHKLEP